jgi:hypothetical protein
MTESQSMTEKSSSNLPFDKWLLLVGSSVRRPITHLGLQQGWLQTSATIYRYCALFRLDKKRQAFVKLNFISLFSSNCGRENSRFSQP